MKIFDPLKAIRQNCLDCCRGNNAEVRRCQCDGKLSTLCPLWFYRFGVRYKTAIMVHGIEAVTPGYADEAGNASGVEEESPESKVE
jgi:hypothetical protein